MIDKKADEYQKWFFSSKAVEEMLRVREAVARFDVARSKSIDR